MSVMATGVAGAWLAADPEQVRAAARALAATAQSNDRTVNVLETAAHELVAGDSWQGEASQRFLTHWGTRSAQLRAQVASHREASVALDRFAAELEEAQADFERAAAEAELLGGRLSQDGEVVFPNPVEDGIGVLLTNPVGGAVNPDVFAVSSRARDAIERVQIADTTVTVALNTLAGQVQVPRPEFPAGLPALLQAGRSGTAPGATAELVEGIDPAFAAAWFGALSPVMQQRLIRSAPELIGNLDGLPPAARDQANRILIEAAMGQMAGQEPREKTLQRLLDSDLQILRIDPEGDGRVVVAMGDLTTARDVVIRIPGTSTNLDNIFGPVLDGARLQGEIGRTFGHAAAESTAVVTWLDYDAPDEIPDAVSDGYARDAAPTLSEFNDGLRVVYGDPHVTMLGHSYGSTVIGLSATDHGIQADELIFIGSPGVVVGSVEELNLGEDTNVWASLNENDDIKWANNPLIDRLILGPDPTRPEFGAESFTSNADAGHSDYFRQEKADVALRNMGRIVTGHLEDVQ